MYLLKKAICVVIAAGIFTSNIFVGAGQSLIVNAEKYGDYLTYRKVDEDEDGIYDYVEITGCDKSVAEINIPAEIDGLTVNSIGTDAFLLCSLTNVTIPDGVTSIGRSAFSSCSSLISITIPDSVTSIGASAFRWCTGLTSITIPKGVTSIGYDAFSNCTDLRSITILDGVASIGKSAFDCCSSLENINVSKNNNNYTSIDGVLFDKEKTELIKYPICNAGLEFVIPNSVISIGSEAFSGCKALISMIIPDSVTSIGSGAFRECTSLTNITIKNPNCKIYGGNSTISDSDHYDGYYYDGVIYGYKNSTAQEYAVKYSYIFEEIDGETSVVTTSPSTTTSNFEVTGYSNIKISNMPEATGKCRTSFLREKSNGGYQTAVYNQGKIYIKNFSDDYQVESFKEIDLELPIWGGIFLGEVYNYVVCGKTYDKQLENGGEVYRIIKYSKDFERIGSISLNGEETYTTLPFDSGNVSVDENGDLLTIYTSRLRRDGHQSNIAIHINTTDMTISNKYGMISFPDVHVSHSFRQIVKYDDKDPVYVDVSDGYPQRSVFIQDKNIKKALINIGGEDGDNLTYAELSGLEISDTNYLVVGSYLNQDSNNIFLSSIDKNSGNVENQWLTDSSSFAPKYFHNPRIVKIEKNKFLVMWGSLTTQYILVDGKGNIISELKSSSAPITDCEPIYANGKILYISVESGIMKFHEITDFSLNGIHKPKEAELVRSNTSWDGTSDISWYDDSKEKFDIFTSQQLAGLAQIVNNGNNFEGKKINLCQDIFLNDESYQYVWTPIGMNYTNVFQGTFYGNSHKIYNMLTSDSGDGGLFGFIGEKGSVKCVDVSQGYLYSGGCIAKVNKGHISFCNNYSCIRGLGLESGCFGGICNKNYNLVYGCKNFGEVTSRAEAAGIVGDNVGGTISQCSNHGLVGGSCHAAGIAYWNGGGGWIYNCYNKGIIADSAGYGVMNLKHASSISGIVDYNDNFHGGVVENCYSAGMFSRDPDEPYGTVYGICYEVHNGKIGNCYVTSGNVQQGAKKVTPEELASPFFIKKLDRQRHILLPVWKEDVNKINDGLPITVADESSFIGQYKIQPEVWLNGKETVIEKNLEDEKYDLTFSCYFNDSDPILTIENTDIATISENNIILFKKAGTTYINMHFNETENNSSADYQLILKINGDAVETTTTPSNTQITVTTVTTIAIDDLITTATTAQTTTNSIITAPIADITVPTGVTATKYGDINLDGEINISDVVAINLYILNQKKYPLEDKAIANADCVRDNVINTSDSTILMNYAAEIIEISELGK